MKKVFILITVIFLSSCSNNKYSSHKSDPIQPINRAIYSFNKGADSLYINPIASVYDKVIPEPGHIAVGNFFNNIAEVPNVINALLQGKAHQAINDTSRFMVNSTFGILGIFDVASKLGLPKHKEDFGQTLRHWGYKDSSYIVLPLFGPSTVRDSIGLVGNYYMSPQRHYLTKKWRYRYTALNIIHKRKELFETEKVLDAASIDEYAVVRDSYLQRREYLTSDQSEDAGSSELLGEPPE